MLRDKDPQVCLNLFTKRVQYMTLSALGSIGSTRNIKNATRFGVSDCLEELCLGTKPEPAPGSGVLEYASTAFNLQNFVVGGVGQYNISQTTLGSLQGLMLSSLRQTGNTNLTVP